MADATADLRKSMIGDLSGGRLTALIVTESVE